MFFRRILIVDDEKNIRVSLKGVLEDEGYVVETAPDGATGLEQMRKFAPDVVLLDIWMPGEDGIQILDKIKNWDPMVEVIMMSGHGTVETAVRAIKLGAFDFVEKPLQAEKVILLLKHAFELKELQRENRYLREELLEEEHLIAQSPPMEKLKEKISLAAPSSGWVCVKGEEGSGKELVARLIHYQSERSHHRFVIFRLGRLGNLFIEEIRGVQKGYKGATETRIGKLEQAEHGTLFLDGIEKLSLEDQTQLLELLRVAEFSRLGSQQKHSASVRVISATSVDLEKWVESGKFLPELFTRLSVIPLEVPPLRERKEDIAVFVRHFLARYGMGRELQVSEKTLRILKAYSWPGNVRELKNWTERACILSKTELIDSVHFDGLDKVAKSNRYEQSQAIHKPAPNA